MCIRDSYTCTATVSSTSSFLTDSGSTSGTARVTVGKPLVLLLHITSALSEVLYTLVGVYLSLKRSLYSNNSVISITEIGETAPDDISQNEGLQCITDRMPCCTRTGEWYFPNGTTVGTSVLAFYINNGQNDGTVNLNRLNSHVMSPTGQFCCVVPDATLTYQTLCAIISKLMYVTSNNLTI